MVVTRSRQLWVWVKHCSFLSPRNTPVKQNGLNAGFTPLSPVLLMPNTPPAGQNDEMDDTDRQLISLLRKDARTPVATLAAKLGVSRGTVSNRLRKLEDGQMIVGYTLRLRPDAEPNQIRAWMWVLVDGNQTRAVIASLLGEPAVASLHDTNGRWDLLAELRAETMTELSRVLERIRLTAGIANTETSILLATYR